MNKQKITLFIALGITCFLLGGSLAVIHHYTSHIVQLENGIVYLAEMINDNTERIEALEVGE
jgi:hypothetical protein